MNAHGKSLPGSVKRVKACPLKGHRGKVRIMLESSRSEAVVINIVHGVLAGYYGKDSHSTDNIEFVINELSRLNRKAALGRFLMLLMCYTFLDISNVRGTYSVTNKKGIHRTQKAKAKAELEAFEWSELTRLSQHPLLGGVPGKEKRPLAAKAKKKRGGAEYYSKNGTMYKCKSVSVVSGGAFSPR